MIAPATRPSPRAAAPPRRRAPPRRPAPPTRPPRRRAQATVVALDPGFATMLAYPPRHGAEATFCDLAEARGLAVASEPLAGEALTKDAVLTTLTRPPPGRPRPARRPPTVEGCFWEM